MGLFSPNSSQIELAVSKERVHFLEEKVQILEERARISEERVDRTLIDLYDERLQRTIVTKDLEHTQNLLEHMKQTHASKSKTAYGRACATSCISFVESVLTNIGTNLLFSPPPHSALAYIALGISGVLSITRAIVTAIMAKGD